MAEQSLSDKLVLILGISFPYVMEQMTKSLTKKILTEPDNKLNFRSFYGKSIEKPSDYKQS